jgi:hypothetical protein
MHEDSTQPVLLYPACCSPMTLYFREEPDDPGGSVDVLDADDTDQDQEKGVRCGTCNFLITSQQEQCSRSGKNRHTFFNPAGIVYEIGCFRKAPGCLVYGPSSREFAWFAGYLWQICYCGECLEHLGWYFSSSEDGFFGLIVSRLVEG